ncbi:type II secretion system F family protein [Thalassotalea fusca]
MNEFKYEALDKNGGRVSGHVEALDKQAAQAQVQQLGYIPTEIKLVSGEQNGFSLFNKKVNLADIEFLTSELSLLLESGVRIDKGIDIIKRTKAKPELARLLTDISAQLKKGKSLSESVRQYPEVFDPLYCNLIELGEASGNLSEIFAGLSKDLSFKRELQRKIKSSLAYPTVIFFVCILSIVFIFNFIIPKMSGMFKGAEAIPWYTELMLDISEWMVNYQMFLFIGVIASIVGIVQLFKEPKVVRWWHAKSLSLPVLKNAIITVERIRFNSGLALMVKAGVQIDKAIALSAGNIKNYVLKREMDIARNKVKTGHALTGALKQTSLYPDFYVSLLEVGEESGNLERVFDEIATRSRKEFESWAERMTTLLEPLMILFMGGIVGGVVVMMLVSMVSINEFGV